MLLPFCYHVRPDNLFSVMFRKKIFFFHSSFRFGFILGSKCRYVCQKKITTNIYLTVCVLCLDSVVHSGYIYISIRFTIIHLLHTYFPAVICLSIYIVENRRKNRSEQPKKSPNTRMLCL